MNIVIPMAGLGDRFKREGYTKPKPLIDINGKPMIQRVIETLGFQGLKPQYIFIVNNKIDEISELKKLLTEITENPIIIEIDYLTDGPACSLLAKEYINNTEPLLITNCDQIMDWFSYEFICHLNNSNSDAIVVTYPIITNKNSYVQVNEQGHAIRFAEKEIISNESLNGIHIWRNGCDFVKSAESMISKNIRVNNEFYIAPTFNEMILEGKIITTYNISLNAHWAVGTPEDLQKYLNYANIQTK
jgi:dTDP-glucose pyrophosphorylase